MYRRKRTLFDKFSLTKSSIQLPKDSVIDSILLKCEMTVANAKGGGVGYSGNIGAVLSAISNIRIISNASNIHYSVNGLDIGILNYYDHLSLGADPDETVSIADAAHEHYTIYLEFNQGDILAVIKESLEMIVEVTPTIETGVTVTEFTGTVTLKENVMSSAEFVSYYGAKNEKIAEPKIITIEKDFAISEELTPFLSIPTGTLLKRALLIVKSTAGVRGGVIPTKFGILREKPERSEMFALDYATMREINALDYGLAKGALDGVITVDYGREITNDNYGLKGWQFLPETYKMAMKSATAGAVRLISVEYIVNTAALDAANSQGAVFEA